MATANNHLAIHLHRLLAEEKTNVFFSPFSISTAMAMIFFAAEGETAAEMKSALGYNDVGITADNLATSVQRLTSDLMKSKDCYTLASANSMLFQKDFPVKADFKSILTESFKALLIEVDFQTDSKNIVKQINDWVKEKTNNMIPSLIESLDRNTVMVLLNAVYFKGSWLQKFNQSSTEPRAFLNYGDMKNAKPVDMMNLKETFRYTENDAYQALQLPYLGEDIAMVILLPVNIDGLEAVEASFTPSFIQELSKSMRKKKVKVTLPRFRLEYSQSLIPFFKKLGVGRIFGSGAELGRATDSRGIVVSEIYHKAVLEVNEEGSEAAAVTMAIMARKAMRLDPVFMVDHPFSFVIYDTRNDLILFMGRVEEL